MEAKMPLSREDAIELTQFAEQLLRQHDPGSYELVMRSTDRVNDPGRNLLILLGTLIRFYKERSGGEHARILDAINHYVRLSDGGPVQGLSVELSPAEREIYGVAEIDLAILPDRSNFLEEIERIRGDIERELIPRERNE
jgi:hypothetical protein